MNAQDQPAFPQWDGHAITSEPLYLRGGMSLRDYFAAMALQGLLASNPEINQVVAKSPEKCVAVAAYNFADAMIAERNQRL